MIYVTVLIISPHRKMLQLQTRRQAHLPLADVEEVVAGRLARPINRGEGRRPVVMEHACVRKVGAAPRHFDLCTGPCARAAPARPTRRTSPRPRPRSSPARNERFAPMARRRRGDLMSARRATIFLTCELERLTMSEGFRVANVSESKFIGKLVVGWLARRVMFRRSIICLERPGIGETPRLPRF